MNKKHYYVLVFTKAGPKYVTKTEYHTAKWNVNEAPHEFKKSWAEDITIGLNMNGYPAVTVESPWEIDNHPYRYSAGQFEWKQKEVE